MRTPRQCSRIVVTALILLAGGQLVPAAAASNRRSAYSTQNRPAGSVCSGPMYPAAVAALQLVCLRALPNARALTVPAIVVGFVGGFANPSDQKHPEVLFAAYLREHYGSNVHAKVFSNHNEKGALQYVLELLDTNHDGAVSDEEKSNARVVIYGHSWGASQTVAFATELAKHGIPVLLTVQLDIITKLRQQPSRIPSNVERAVNFYQREGFLEGQSEILASDVTRTTILGNFRLTYRHRHVNCHNYPWVARTFNKPHHEIENDPRVWETVAALIDAELSTGIRDNSRAILPASL